MRPPGDSGPCSCSQPVGAGTEDTAYHLVTQLRRRQIENPSKNPASTRLSMAFPPVPVQWKTSTS